jgi:hypothetical protein
VSYSESSAEHPPTHPESVPHHLPRPTPWPMVMAWGVTMVFGGIATNVVFSVAGIFVFAVALIGWIRELMHA